MTCSDVDECAGAPNPCSANATCTNISGSYSCACKPGYTGDGVSCREAPQTCDLTGTFALLTETDVEWDAVRISGIVAIQGGSQTLKAWSLHSLQARARCTDQTEHA